MNRTKSLLLLFFTLFLAGLLGCTGSSNDGPASSTTNETTETSALTAIEDDETAVQPTPLPTPLPPSETESEPVDEEVVIIEETMEEVVDQVEEETAVSNTTTTINADVWADNWFAFYLGEELIQEDSVSITTERSFNAESFAFEGTYPLVLNFIAKDFKENDTGLEYIGSNRQQMGDGGLIAQFRDANSGQLIAATDANWKCTIIHQAPLDKSCANESNPVAGEGACEFTSLAEPTDWKSATFDESAWQNATVYGTDQVGPKDGYDRISWDTTAELIWTTDLETDNTILCRIIINQP